jgi:hypothetical protein
MRPKSLQNNKAKIVGGAFILLFLMVGYIYLGELFPQKYDRAEAAVGFWVRSTTTIPTYAAPALDLVDYDRRMVRLANISTGSTSSLQATSTITKKQLWPAKVVYPKAGAILPFHRVVAYYGNLYSKGMGILGEYPEGEMLRRLDAEVAKWELADPLTPVQPALHYIVTTAQGSAGDAGKYRLRMPSTEIDKVLAMAKKRKAIVFLDIQVGLSNYRAELPPLAEYLKLPQVHLGIDPEFSMKTGAKPGTVIGTVDATDVNYVAEYLAQVVRDNNLPPKILIVHRFTQAMVTNYRLIKPLPEVQIVMDMDGWGAPAQKIDSYNGFVASEPVQFTGFKLFYKNDLKQTPNRLMTPAELLKLKPQPIYIQYQ